MSCKFLCIILLLVFSFQSEAILIWLNDGSVAHGIITGYTKSFIAIELLERDGQVEIPWREIHPACRERIKKELGMIEERPISYTIPGVKVYLKNGQVVYGEVIAEKKHWLLLQSRSNSGPIRISKSNVLRRENVDIAIGNIYSQERIYKKYRDKYKLKTAKGNLKFAHFLLKTGQYMQAKTHLQKALKLDPKLAIQTEPLQKLIAKNELEQSQRDGLKKIKYYRRYHRYQDALVTLEKIKKELGKERYAQLQSKIALDQKQYLQKELPKRWFRKVSTKTAHFCRRRNSMLQEAKDYALQTMPEEIVDELAKDFQISSDALDRYFEHRSPGLLHKYSYGSGTFIVAPTPPDDRGYIDDKMQISFSRKAIKPLLSSEQWWKESGSTKRSQWLSAYYWENTTGNCQVTSKICPSCGGTGKKVVYRKVSVFALPSGEREGKGKKAVRRKVIACSVCNGSGHERIVEIK